MAFDFNFGGGQADVFAQQEAIARRQKVLEALQQQNANTPLVGGGGGLQAIARVLAAGVADRRRTGLENEAAANRRQYSSQLQGQLGQYLDTYQGKPAQLSQQEAVDREDNPLPSMDVAPTKANPREAVLRAMTSQFPEMQTIGKTGFAELAKKDMPRYEKIGDSYYQIMPDGTSRKIVSNEKQLVVNNQLVNPNREGTPQVTGDFRDKFGPIKELGQDEEGHKILGTTEQQTGKPVFAPRGVTVNTGEKASESFAKALGVQKAAAIEKSFVNAQSAQKALEALGAARKDYEAGIKSGAAAPMGLALSKWAKAFGLGEVDPTIANTEAYRSNMAREVFNLVRNLGSGTGISNADREYAEKAAGGLISLDDAAMSRLMDVSTAAAGNVLVNHERMLQSAAKSSGGNEADLDMFRVWADFNGGPNVVPKGTSGLFEAVRPATATTSPKVGAAKPPLPQGVMSLDEYLKKP
jgi:hypothetical protein